jgi:D-alanine--poly(phosphoribitol) ligase subunit 1
LPNRTCALLRELFPQTQLYNAYGPTEATVATTLIRITDAIIQQHPMLPVGYPMAGSDLFIEKQNEADKEGELIISGDHVSIGYFKNEALNAEKFFLHNGKRAFRTGDLAYFEDGLLFCIGRNDDQVKMNGFRIELNEISAVLCRHEAVSDAVTVALKRNNEVKKLISFVLLSSPENAEATMSSLVPFMGKIVPYYMIPGDIVAVDAFPHSVSHKIDKKQLIADYLQRQLG